MVPRIQRFTIGLALVSLVPVARAQGQAGAPPVSVHGVAYDSIRNRPLADAFVAVVGSGASTTTDARGRFHLDSIAPGPHTIELQHALLDSVGLSGVRARVIVSDGRDDIRLATPSFATLWRAACGPTPPPRDSGLVYGTVRDARDHKPVVAAIMELAWIDFAVDQRTKGISQQQWRGQSRSDATGSFALCGTPTAMTVRVQARAEGRASGTIDLPPSDLRVRRQDLSIGAVTEPDSTRRGIIAGLITDPAGAPFIDARIVMNEVPEVRSGADGRFTIRNVPAGTREVQVLSVGMQPVVSTVDVIPGDTTRFMAQLKKVTTLATVNVTSMRYSKFMQEFAERRKLGFGYVQDSTTLGTRGMMVSVFEAFPSIRVNRGRGRAFNVQGPEGCVLTLWLDGFRQITYDVLTDLYPEQIAVVEVYPRSLTTPPEFIAPNSSRCGSVAVWTKSHFK